MVDDSFVPSYKQPSVIYCRLTDFSSDSLTPASVLLDSQALLGNELSEFKALVVGKSKKCSFSFACLKLEGQHPRVPPRDALICLMRPPPRHYHVCSTQCGQNNFQTLKAEFLYLCYFMIYIFLKENYL